MSLNILITCLLDNVRILREEVEHVDCFWEFRNYDTERVLGSSKALVTLPLLLFCISGKVRYGPSFTQMSQWRGVLHRLTCFIRMIDFLVMELLRRLVLTALRTFLAQVKAASMRGRYLHVNRFSRVKVVLKRTVVTCGE